jgi:hypothetical protein
MYFWRTSQLVKELRTEALGEADFKNYYLATSILASIGCSFYIVLIPEPQNMFAFGLVAVGVVLITILGINAAFKANGGSAGVRFVEKTVSISFPLLIKVSIASSPLWFVVGFAMACGLSKYQSEWIDAAVTLVIQTVFFWRLIVHVRATNA